MKKNKILLFLILSTIVYVSQASARLNETREQLIKRYGKPIAAEKAEQTDWHTEKYNYWYKNIFGDPINWELLRFDVDVDGAVTLEEKHEKLIIETILCVF